MLIEMDTDQLSCSSEKTKGDFSFKPFPNQPLLVLFISSHFIPVSITGRKYCFSNLGLVNSPQIVFVGLYYFSSSIISEKISLHIPQSQQYLKFQPYN